MLRPPLFFAASDPTASWGPVTILPEVVKCVLAGLVLLFLPYLPAVPLVWCYLSVDRDSSINSAVKESLSYFLKNHTPSYCSWQPLTASSHWTTQCTGTASGSLAFSIYESTSRVTDPVLRKRTGTQKPSVRSLRMHSPLQSVQLH